MGGSSVAAHTRNAYIAETCSISSLTGFLTMTETNSSKSRVMKYERFEEYEQMIEQSKKE